MEGGYQDVVLVQLPVRFNTSYNLVRTRTAKPPGHPSRTAVVPFVLEEIRLVLVRVEYRDSQDQ